MTRKFQLGDEVRVVSEHMYLGDPQGEGLIRIGGIHTVTQVGPERGRMDDDEHVVLDHKAWIHQSCLELTDPGPTEEEIAAAFGIKADPKAESEAARLLQEAWEAIVQYRQHVHATTGKWRSHLVDLDLWGALQELDEEGALTKSPAEIVEFLVTNGIEPILPTLITDPAQAIVVLLAQHQFLKVE